MKAYISDLKHLTHDVCTISLSLPHRQRLRFVAGQFIDISVKGFPSRPYSIANTPDSDFIEIHVRASGKQGLSDYIFENIQPGATLDISQAKGAAFFNSTTDTPLYLIAGGTGISYAKSIAEQALKNNHSAPIHLVWANDYAHDFYLNTYFKDLVRAHAVFHYIETLKRPDKILKSICDNYASSDIYLAGPLPMVEACGEALLLNGALLENIMSDMDF